MRYLQRYGSIKPGRGARIDLEHPFAKAHLCSLLANEGVGYVPALTFGKIPRGALTVSNGPATWRSNREGLAYNLTTSQVLTLAAAGDYFPTNAITLLFVRRKTDATNRSAALFSYNEGGGEGSNYINALVPWSDGATRWYFGGNSGANILQVTMTHSTTIPERLIFTAGPKGSSIWQNGIKVASQSTAISRTSSTAAMRLNGSTIYGSDNIELNFFSALGEQWSDNLCQWWSASPYEHLYYDTFGTKYFFLGGVSSDVTGTMTVSAPAPTISIIGDYVNNPNNTRVQPPGNTGVQRPFQRFKT